MSIEATTLKLRRSQEHGSEGGQLIASGVSCCGLALLTQQDKAGKTSDQGTDHQGHGLELGGFDTSQFGGTCIKASCVNLAAKGSVLKDVPHHDGDPYAKEAGVDQAPEFAIAQVGKGTVQDCLSA